MVGTHHIGASTQQAQDAIAAGVVEIIDAFVQGETPNCVNLTPSRIGSATLTVRHLDRVGVLAHVLDRLSRDRLNVEHMQNRVFRGGDAAVATIDVAGSAVRGPARRPGRPARRVRGLGDHHRRHDMTGVVRPFEARVVRQEWAAQAVTPMVDALGTGRPPAPVPATAYEHSPRAFYVYRMRRGSDDHVGVVADVRLDAFAGGGIRGHESVEPQRVDALVRYYADLPTRSEPVALLHAHRPATTSRVEDICRGRPLLHFPGPDGLEHTVWRVTGDEETADLAAAWASGVHYIADGHHRVAARLRAWESSRPAGRRRGAVHALRDGRAHHVGVPPARLRPGRRRRAARRRGRPLRRCGGCPRPTQASGIGHVRRGVLVRPGPDRTPAPRERPGWTPPSCRTDSSAPRWASPGRAHPRLEVLPDHVPLEQPTARCDEDGGALFVLRPPSLDRLTGIADLGEQMPPKTTYFAPKPSAGIFLT